MFDIIIEQKTRLIATLRHELLLKQIQFQELHQSQMKLVQVCYLMFVTFDNGEADVVVNYCVLYVFVRLVYTQKVTREVVNVYLDELFRMDRLRA